MDLPAARRASRDQKLPFPDGTISGPPRMFNFMEGLKKYPATGGWGFADFKNGKSGNEAAA
jgi:hypothetical protein